MKRRHRTPNPGSDEGESSRWPAFLPLAALLIAAAASHTRAGVPAPARITYRVSRFDSGRHTVRVECRLPGSGEMTLALPRWIPGYYYRMPLRDYLSDVTLTYPEGRALPLREEPSRWAWHANVPAGESATFSYTVRAAEGAGNRGLAQLFVGARTAFLLPAATFVYVETRQETPCALQLALPAGWSAIAPLPFADGAFQAENFEQLGDSPVDMGEDAPGALRVARTQAAKHPLCVVTSGPVQATAETIEEVTRRAIEAHAALFGAVPFPDYTIEMHSGTGGDSGIIGLEHARAATLAFWDGYPLNDANLRGAGASLVFHETLHAWNVKTMRPSELSPYHLDELPHCPTLWFAEGFTDYYASLEPVRCGLWSRPGYFYESLASAWSRYASSLGRHRTSLMRASATTADDSQYGEGGGTNYYDKGTLVACLLDLEIRSRTHGAKSLDDVMRWVYRRYPASRGGYPDDFLPGAILAAAGVDLSSDCHNYLETTEDLPVADRLSLAGLQLDQNGNPARIRDDPGANPEALRLRRAWLARR